MKRIFTLLVMLYFWGITAHATPTSTDSLSIDYYGHLYLHGLFCNHPGRFIFDSGAYSLYPDSIYLADTHLKFKKIIQAHQPGAGIKAPLVPVILDTVTYDFGSHSYFSQISPILQLKPILGDRADGIIGLEYFQDKIFGISYEKNLLHTYSKLTEADTAGYTPFPLKLRKGKLFFPIAVAINDSISIKGDVLMDLGSGSSISLTSATSGKYGLASAISRKLNYYTRYGGIGGESYSHEFRALNVQIGPWIIPEILMNYSSDPSGALSSDTHIGLAGNDLWERFDMIFDLPNLKLYLRPNKHFDEPFRVGRLGFSYVDRSKTLGYWVVSGMYIGSHAEKAGLRVDDHILEWDGKNVKEIDERHFSLQGKNHIHLTIVRKGEKRTIEFDPEDGNRL